MHVNTSLGGIFQGVFQLAVQNKIRRHNINVVLRTVQHIYIYLFADLVLVEGAVAVGHYKAVFSLRRNRYVKKLVEIPVLFVQSPHVKKHSRKASRGFALYHYGGIFPMSVLFIGVYIFVRQIYASVKGNFSVDNQYFSVVSVIVMG